MRLEPASELVQSVIKSVTDYCASECEKEVEEVLSKWRGKAKAEMYLALKDVTVVMRESYKAHAVEFIIDLRPKELTPSGGGK